MSSSIGVPPGPSAKTRSFLCAFAHLPSSAMSAMLRTARSIRHQTIMSYSSGRRSHAPSSGRSKGVVFVADTSRSSASPTTTAPRRAGLVVSSVLTERRIALRARNWIMARHRTRH
ncbi:hypothetical protein OG359_13775 [Streptomyces viridodiastaticus]|nr:hypothetical protein [Streptomyces viridodiastaticus]MCX4620652.1 hypothetical protein [Streptomyces viridodiastaticus]